MKSILERNAENRTEYKMAMFKVKQSLPYECKKVHAARRAWQFYNTINGRGQSVHVSVGGLDSITLLVFLKSIQLDDVPAISVSSILPQGDPHEAHRQLARALRRRLGERELR